MTCRVAMERPAAEGDKTWANTEISLLYGTNLTEWCIHDRFAKTYMHCARLFIDTLTQRPTGYMVLLKLQHSYNKLHVHYRPLSSICLQISSANGKASLHRVNKIQCGRTIIIVHASWMRHTWVYSLSAVLMAWAGPIPRDAEATYEWHKIGRI